MKRNLTRPLRAFLVIYRVYRSDFLLYAITSLISLAIFLRAFWPGILVLFLGVGATTLHLIRQIRREAERIESDPKGLALNVRAPLVSARDASKMGPSNDLDLGDRPSRISFELTIILHNIGNNELAAYEGCDWDPDILDISGLPQEDKPIKISPGEVKKLCLTVTPKSPARDGTRIIIGYRWQGGEAVKRLKIRSIFDHTSVSIREASISRWKYGNLAAVCWRGDLDGLDNLSNEKTLNQSFKLCRRFRFPLSLFISGRLTLNFDEWSSWVQHFPDKFLEEKATRERFDRFTEYLIERISSDDLEYPIDDGDKPVSVGNHMYLHYGSSYGYDAGCTWGWKKGLSPIKAGHLLADGMTDPQNPVEALALNIKMNQEIISSKLGVTPETWAAPADTSHPKMPRALDASGLKGSSEAHPRGVIMPREIDPYRPPLGAVRPYHPPDREVVETQAHIHRFDPHTPTQLICLKKGVLEALECGKQVTFLIHPHLRLYRPFYGQHSSRRPLRELMRFLVGDKGSLIWITTHASLVKYWEAVLCPVHGEVNLDWGPEVVRIANPSDDPISGVPIDVEFDGGKRAMFMVDLPARSSLNLLG